MDSISFPTAIAGAETLTITGDAAIMQNYQTALPVAADQPLGAVQDSTGAPMIFSVGSDGQLYLICADPGGATGWRQIDLTPSLAGIGTPTDFAVGQVPGGLITLIVAAQAADGSTALVIAGPLTNDLTAFDWTGLAALWVSVPNPQPDGTLDALFVGPVDASGGFGVPLIATGYTDVPAGAIDNFLLVPSVAAGLTWGAIPFPTPTDASAINAYAMGCIADLGVGLYMLYENDLGEPILVFRTLPDADYNKSFTRELSVPAGATSLAALAASGGTTDLYVGGQGVVRFAPDNQTDKASPTAVASADDMPDIAPDSLMVRGDVAGDVTLWALSGETLRTVSTRADGGYDRPVVFERGVANLAPLRSGDGANQLAFFKTDVQTNPSIVWMAQDPASSIWQRDLIPLQASDAMYEFNCYTTTLTLYDALDRPRAGLPLRIHASDRARVIVNGVSHVLDAHSSAVVVSDVTGQITLINPVDDLATPRFYLTAPQGAFADTVVIDPAWPVYQRLQAVQTGADIPDSVLSAGQLPEDVTKDQVAAAIAELMAWTPDTPPPSGVVALQASTAQVQAKAARPTRRHAFAIRPRPVQTAALSVVDEVWDDVTNAAGELWQFATSVIDEVLHIVIEAAEDALTFVVELVGKTIRIVLKTIADVFRAITYLLKALAAALEALIKWLGFLFGWQDIWDGHKVLANFTNSALSWFETQTRTEIDGWKATISGGFEALRSSIDRLILPDDVASTDLQSAQKTAAQTSETSTNTAAASFTSYQLQHGGSGGTPAEADPPGSSSGPLADFINDIVVPTIDTVKDDLEDVFAAIAKLFQGNPTMEGFLEIIVAVLDTFIDVAETLILGFLDLIADLVGDLRSFLSAPLDIPFFSQLYRFVTGLLGEAEDLSLVNVASLMAAIPLTVLYKAGTGASPFPDGVDALLDPAVFTTMMDGLKGAPAAKRSTLVLAAESDDGADDGDSVDKSSAAYIYSHYCALGPALCAVLSDVVSAISFNRGMRELNAEPGEGTPIDPGVPGGDGDGDGEDDTKIRLSPLEIVSLVLDGMSLALGFPLPDGDGVEETLAVLEWLVGWGQAVGTLTIEKLIKRFTKSEKAAKLTSAGWDAVLAIIDAGLLIACDIMESVDVLKYFQDLASVGGALLQDLGTGLSTIPSASVKIGALAAEGSGVVVKCLGTVFLFVRVVATATEDEIMRVQFH